MEIGHRACALSKSKLFCASARYPSDGRCEIHGWTHRESRLAIAGILLRIDRQVSSTLRPIGGCWYTVCLRVAGRACMTGERRLGLRSGRNRCFTAPSRPPALRLWHDQRSVLIPRHLRYSLSSLSRLALRARARSAMPMGAADRRPWGLLGVGKAGTDAGISVCVSCRSCWSSHG